METRQITPAGQRYAIYYSLVMLLETAALARRWMELLATCSRLDIAVAWITNKGCITDLVKFAATPGRQVRVIAGVNDHLNDLECLRQLHELGVLKIVVRKGYPLFHPKLYLFALAEGTVCWIGSANLTGEGFGGNVELVHEHHDDGSAALWFERTWAAQKYSTSEWVTEYEEACKKLPVGPPAVPLPRLANPGGPLDSWEEYVAELKRVDEKWIARTDGQSGVFSGTTSHLGTIRLAQDIFAKDWASLSKTEARILLGLTEDGTDYGALGSMQGAGIAKNVFLEATPKNLKIRREIQDEINRLLKVSLGSGLPLMARKAHEVITNRERFSGGIATRLLALARPEVLVSVNNESVHCLSEWSMLPANSIRTSTGYEKLIRRVMSSAWWNVPAPIAGLDCDSCQAKRAALFAEKLAKRNSETQARVGWNFCLLTGQALFLQVDQVAQIGWLITN